MGSNEKSAVRGKLRFRMHAWCDAVELGLAILVGLVLVIDTVCYTLAFFHVLPAEADTASFQSFLMNIFNLVVGLEFIKMLLKPNVKNVIDVLIFLVARHMIIGKTSPGGMLLCVLCIVLLYGFWFSFKYLRLRDETFCRATESDVVCLMPKKGSKGVKEMEVHEDL